MLISTMDSQATISPTVPAELAIAVSGTPIPREPSAIGTIERGPSLLRLASLPRRLSSASTLAAMVASSRSASESIRTGSYSGPRSRRASIVARSSSRTSLSCCMTAILPGPWHAVIRPGSHVVLLPRYGAAMEIMTPRGPARVDLDEGERLLLVLTHGSAGTVDAPDLLAVRHAALKLGVAVPRVTQPFRVAGGRAPGSPGRQDEAWLAVVAELRARMPGLPLVQGGRRNGARVD